VPDLDLTNHTFPASRSLKKYPELPTKILIFLKGGAVCFARDSAFFLQSSAYLVITRHFVCRVAGSYSTSSGAEHNGEGGAGGGSIVDQDGDGGPPGPGSIPDAGVGVEDAVGAVKSESAELYHHHFTSQPSPVYSPGPLPVGAPGDGDAAPGDAPHYGDGVLAAIKEGTITAIANT